MKGAISFLASILLISWISLMGAAHAGAMNDFVLVGGTRAVIEGKTLILIGRDSRRSIAPPGRYDTRDGRYSIIVKSNEIVIRDHTKAPR
jgi:hypothetical protein